MYGDLFSDEDQVASRLAYWKSKHIQIPANFYAVVCIYSRNDCSPDLIILHI